MPITDEFTAPQLCQWWSLCTLRALGTPPYSIRSSKWHLFSPLRWTGSYCGHRLRWQWQCRRHHLIPKWFNVRWMLTVLYIDTLRRVLYRYSLNFYSDLICISCEICAVNDPSIIGRAFQKANKRKKSIPIIRRRCGWLLVVNLNTFLTCPF